jgi:hypothetical protein
MDVKEDYVRGIASSGFQRINTVTRPLRRLERAVVLGGSIAGLLAARVLADHADTVVVIERDELTQGVSDRAGVPHGYQAHTLLPGGSAQIERWFPGIHSRSSGSRRGAQ